MGKTVLKRLLSLGAAGVSGCVGTTMAGKKRCQVFWIEEGLLYWKTPSNPPPPLMMVTRQPNHPPPPTSASQNALVTILSGIRGGQVSSEMASFVLALFLSPLMIVSQEPETRGGAQTHGGNPWIGSEHISALTTRFGSGPVGPPERLETLKPLSFSWVAVQERWSVSLSSGLAASLCSPRTLRELSGSSEQSRMWGSSQAHTHPLSCSTQWDLSGHSRHGLGHHWEDNIWDKKGQE